MSSSLFNSRVPRLVFVPTLVLATLIVSSAFAAHRGIPLNSKDLVKTAIEPAGDSDTFVFEGMAGGLLSLKLAPTKGSALVPALELIGPDEVSIDLTDYVKTKKNKITVKKAPLATTGV